MKPFNVYCATLFPPSSHCRWWVKVARIMCCWDELPMFVVQLHFLLCIGMTAALRRPSVISLELEGQFYYFGFKKKKRRSSHEIMAPLLLIILENTERRLKWDTVWRKKIINLFLGLNVVGGFNLHFTPHYGFTVICEITIIWGDLMEICFYTRVASHSCTHCRH